MLLTHPRRMLLILLFLSVAACGDEGASTYDSAPVELATEPLVSIGGDDSSPEHAFGQVTGGVLLAEGGFVILETQAREVRRYGPVGEHVATFGRRGAGPGEFGLPLALAPGVGDSVHVWDLQQRRLTTLSTGDRVPFARLHVLTASFSEADPIMQKACIFSVELPTRPGELRGGGGRLVKSDRPPYTFWLATLSHWRGAAESRRSPMMIRTRMVAMSSYWLLSVLIFNISQPLVAQSTTSGIELVDARQISVDFADRPHVESHIAADPLDAQHLLAAAMVVVEGEMRVFPYASFDGGRNWIRGRLNGDSSMTIGAADPVVHITSDGHSLFSTLADVDGVRRSIVARSTDGGRTWRPTAVLPYADRQWLTSTPNRGLFGGRIYFTGTGVYSSREGSRAVAPFLARSDDGGQIFPLRSVVGFDRSGNNPQVRLNAVPLEPLMTQSGLLVLTLQGSVNEDTAAQFGRDSLNAWTIGLATSDDGGESFGPARYAPKPRISLTGSPLRRFRGHSATGYVRPAIDVSSGAYRNSIYFVAADYDLALDRYVARVWRTRDFGKAWDLSVASDAPRGDVANPAIAVNADGVVAVTWNDRRDDPEGRCWLLYAAISIDGGEHFHPAQRLSNAPTCANDPANWETFGTAFNSDHTGQHLAHFQTGASIPARFPMGGDTQGLTADLQGVFHSAWINGETGILQLWHTSFRADSVVLTELRSRRPIPDDSLDAADPVPHGLWDVTRDVRFHVSDTRLDFTARTYEITLQIENQSNRLLYGPLHAEMRHFLDLFDNGLGLRNLAAANADTGGTGIGASWLVEVPDGVLAPGSRSSSRVVRFTFDGGVPEFPQGYLSPGFRVYARSKQPP